jgi:TolB-like protein/tetratricopeptide (TPR) repeat protein
MLVFRDVRARAQSPLPRHRPDAFSAASMKPGSFFAELKRRNVYKVAVGYAVVGWLLIQVATQVFPFFDIPNWGVRLTVLLIVVGFPIALVIAWAFELTPGGIKRTEEADRIYPGRSRGRAWIYVVISAGLLSAGLFFLGRYTAPNGNKIANVPEKSIAVLPFENLSRDPDNAYFAEGIQDEILTRLAKVADLKVISHTSTQRYKSSPNDLPQIAKQLGVANILEGSVQKSQDQVRVNVQLINAATDAHLWGESFDRKLIDIFAVESEIAAKVADTLQAKLTGPEQHAISIQPTQNTEAYQLYLKGRYFWNKRTGPDLQKAIDYFKQAIDKDPGFALAYVGLGDSYILLSGFGAAPPQDSFPLAEAAAKKALEIDDNLAEAHTTLGFILCVHHLNFADSIREFERAIGLNPNYATAHHWFGDGPLLAVGQFDRAIAEGKRAVELDPLSVIITADLGADYLVARRYDEAIEQFHKAIDLDPRFYYVHWNLAEALEMKGDLRGALAEYKKAAELDDDPFVLALLGQAYAKVGQRDEALKILAQLSQIAAHRYVPSYSFALLHMALGDKDKAIEWLERSYRDGAGLDVIFLKVDPMLDPLQKEPRFQALVAKVFGPKEAAVQSRSSP